MQICGSFGCFGGIKRVARDGLSAERRGFGGLQEVNCVCVFAEEG